MDRVDLTALLRGAAGGRFPPVDGGVSRARPWRAGVEAAVAFTGHAVLAVAAEVSDEALLRLGVHGYGGVHDPRLVAALAGQGEIGVLDVLLVAPATEPTAQAPGPETRPDSDVPVAPLVTRPDLACAERARHAHLWRDDVRVLGLPDHETTGLATLSRGIAGLTEVGIQAEDGEAGQLLAGALARVPRGELVLASVTPGNARSLRFFLRRGFVPVGSVQQWRPRRVRPVDDATG
ncbi:N-acetyltransferase [Ornithinimicrobium pratense]|uniref:N-acetyltransferase n=1 Tax=Ornithinimicrobium pratense TaxID=2593973 RepID=A0A5J6V5B8_9MICO|nr:N-acetyltransferase [Ornithinimicrobium pratense]QFG68975.1 N-acetyltransferase [Ornithinimicrobium pratense]